MLIAALMMRRQRAIVRAFEQAGATTAATACSAGQLGLQPGLAWHQLAGKAVLRCPESGRWFLDRANWQRLRRRRRVTATVVTVALLVLLGLALVLRFG